MSRTPITFLCLPGFTWGDTGVLSCVLALCGVGVWGLSPWALTWMLVLMRFTSQSKRRL